MKTLYFIILIVLIDFGCKKDNDQYELTDLKYLKDPELYNCSNCICFSITGIYGRPGFIIRDNKTYKKYADSMRIFPINSKINCDTATLINIDFNRYSLIGMSLDFEAGDSIMKAVIVDNNNKNINYDITLKKLNRLLHTTLGITLNLALITKIPGDFKVKFNLKTE